MRKIHFFSEERTRWKESIRQDKMKSFKGKVI